MDANTGHSQFVELIDPQFDEISATSVIGTVAADERHHQPWGLVHGGLYTATIETFATMGAFEAVKNDGVQVVGVSNQTDFVRSHMRGRLRAEAYPIHQGRTYQLWVVELRRPEDDKLIARGQVRLQHLASDQPLGPER
jgi:1,4-dihydroxy-2-naphthoyl-CoA hydrolase